MAGMMSQFVYQDGVAPGPSCAISPRWRRPKSRTTGLSAIGNQRWSDNWDRRSTSLLLAFPNLASVSGRSSHANGKFHGMVTLTSLCSTDFNGMGSGPMANAVTRSANVNYCAMISLFMFIILFYFADATAFSSLQPRLELRLLYGLLAF